MIWICLLRATLKFFQDLLTYLETLLRSSLIRFNVSVTSLRKVLHVTTTLYRRAAKASGANPDVQLVNPIAASMLEITKDALNIKARVNPATLVALIEVCFIFFCYI